MRLWLEMVGDFETTVYDGQKRTEVWSSAFCVVGNTDPNKVVVLNSIEETFEYWFELRQNIIIYYHNLKFDGSFILDWLLRKKQFKPWQDDDGLKYGRTKFDLPQKHFSYTISDMGQWYRLMVNYKGYFIEFRDSFKLLPFSLREIGESFQTKHRKLNMEFANKKPGYIPTTAELNYIKNDVLVLSEAMQKLKDENIEGLTIGGICLNEWKKLRYGEEIDYKDRQVLYRKEFPKLDEKTEELVRKSYRGGWCYVNKRGYFKNGQTADINSSYDYQMHSMSKQVFPWGEPMPLYTIPNELSAYLICFMHLRFSFKLKEGYLPCIQVRGDLRYGTHEWLKESGQTNGFDNVIDYYVSDREWAFICERYEIWNLHFVEGVCFNTCMGVFDSYLDKWMERKKNSTGAKRTIAKLFLVNLYGKLSASVRSDYKQYELIQGKLASKIVRDNRQEPGYIPIGSMISAYARMYVIEAAEKNIDVFCYSDTDSMHCCGEIKGIRLHPSDLGAWKIESKWSEGVFSGQKRYIEKINGEYLIRCAGMSPRAKEIFIQGLKSGKYKITDFNDGLEIEGNLRARVIEGGTILEEKNFKLREKI